MKKYFLIIVVLFSFSLFSLLANANENIIDLMRISKKGEFSYDGNLSFGQHEVTVVSTAAGDLFKIKFKNPVLDTEHTLNYGFSDYLNFNIGMGYTSEKYKYVSQVDSTGSITDNKDYKNSGIKNIELGSRYRISKNNPLHLDAILFISLPPGKVTGGNSYTLPDGTQASINGDTYTGGTINLMSEIGSRIKQFEWSTKLGIIFNLAHNETSLKNDSTDVQDIDTIQRYNAAVDLLLDLNAQYNITESWALGTSLDIAHQARRVSHFPNFSGSSTSTKSTEIDDSSFNVNVGLNTKYAVNNKLMFTLGIDYSLPGDSSSSFRQKQITVKHIDYQQDQSTMVKLGVVAIF